jgi:hypothetical protein
VLQPVDGTSRIEAAPPELLRPSCAPASRRVAAGAAEQRILDGGQGSARLDLVKTSDRAGDEGSSNACACLLIKPSIAVRFDDPNPHARCRQVRFLGRSCTDGPGTRPIAEIDLGMGGIVSGNYDGFAAAGQRADVGLAVRLSQVGEYPFSAAESGLSFVVALGVSTGRLSASTMVSDTFQ